MKLSTTEILRFDDEEAIIFILEINHRRKVYK